MTDSIDITQQQKPFPEPLTTAGATWKQAAILKQQRKIPQQRWLKFAANVSTKYASVGTRVAALKNRVQPETFDLPRLDGRFLVDPPATVTTGATPASEPPPALDRSSHFLLDEGVKTFLASLLNIRVPAVKIYANQTADAIAKKYGADALTYRDKILFRAGKYNPQDVAGLALLGHELTHAAQAKMADRNTPSWGAKNIPDKQEQQALENEAKVWQHLSFSANLSSDFDFVSRNRTRRSLSHPLHSSPPIESGGNEQSSRQLPLQRGQPQAALSSRQVNPSPVANMGSNSLPLSEQQLTQVYRYLKNRIRDEFWGGG